MKNFLTALTICLSIFVGTELAAPARAGEVEVAHHMTFMTTPCAMEDSINCYWDASVRGNGQGHSFYSIRVGNMNCIKYWASRYDRTHGKCYPIR